MLSSDSPDLAAILYEAPPLLALLSPQDWAILFSCSKQLNHLIHRSISFITLSKVSDAETVLTSYWPQLALIKVQPAPNLMRERLLSVPQHSNFQLIATLVSNNHGEVKSSIAYIVSHMAEGSQLQSIAAAFRHLQRSDCQHAYSVRITVDPCGMAEEVFFQLTQCNWRYPLNFGVLSVSSGSACMLQLAKAKASWPRLQSLELRGEWLNEVAITSLIQGNWPLLKRLTLRSNLQLNAAAIALISKATSWVALSHLEVTRTKLDSSCTHSIALLHKKLVSLNLAYTSMTTAAILQLTSVPWPKLDFLTLKGNTVAADALGLLEIPVLSHLYLAGTRLAAAAARQLARGSWCKLEYLDLECNDLDDVAMAFLGKGHWPSLRSLELRRNNISVLGLELFLAAPWPKLRDLVLDSAAVPVAKRKLVDVTGRTLLNSDETYQRVSRDVLGAWLGITVNDPVVWPKLEDVLFLPNSPEFARYQDA